MTIRELRKAMRGLDPGMPVYVRAHDNEDWEQQGRVEIAEVFDQSDKDVQRRMKEEAQSNGVRSSRHVEMNTVNGPYLILST